MKLFEGNQGFTLIEVLIAMVIISIVSLGITMLNATIIRGNSFNDRLTAATTLAQDRLEHIQRLGFSNAENASTTEGYGQIANSVAFKRITSIANNSPAVGYKTARVEVFWNTDRYSVVLLTLLTE